MQLHTVTVNHASAQLLGFVYRFSFFNAIISAHDQILYNAPNLGQRESLPLTPVELLLPDSSAQDGKRAMLFHTDQNRRAPVTSSACDLERKHAVMNDSFLQIGSFEQFVLKNQFEKSLSNSFMS